MLKTVGVINVIMTSTISTRKKLDRMCEVALLLILHHDVRLVNPLSKGSMLLKVDGKRRTWIDLESGALRRAVSGGVGGNGVSR